MDSIKHTELPWEVFSNDAEGYHIGTSELEIAVAFNPLEGDPYDTGEADAAFIVKACNNHEKLLDTLRAVAGFLLCDGQDVEAVFSPTKREITEQIDAIRKAIKEAE